MTTTPAWLSWSSGKDSAWALHVIRQQQEFEVVGLFTTITQNYSRVSMHAVREELLGLQAQALGIPLIPAYIPDPCPDAVYADIMRTAMQAAAHQGIRHIIFGDLFLEDVRSYREKQLSQVGLQACFPLWGMNTARLAEEMIASGLGARITCLNPAKISRTLAGHEFDRNFLAQLPEGIDPCGERGEFHTFAYQGPMFQHPVSIQPGEIVERGGFVFTDLLPA